MPGPILLRYRFKDEVHPRNAERHALLEVSDALALNFVGNLAQLVARLELLESALETPAGRAVVSEYLALPEFGVLVVRLANPSPAAHVSLQNLVAGTGGVAAVVTGLKDETGTYLLYAPGEIVVRLKVAAPTAPPWLTENGQWEVVRSRLDYAPAALVIKPAAGQTTEQVFAKAWTTQERDDVACAYPVLVQGVTLSSKPPEPAQPSGGRDELPWHLAPPSTAAPGDDSSARVAAAWRHGHGAGRVIGLVEKVSTEWTHPGLAGRVVAAIDVRQNPAGQQQTLPTGPGPVHATMMAGFAVGALNCPAPGVAPEAEVLAVQKGRGVGALSDADAVYYAASNGACVVSCSWNPKLKGGVAVPIPPHTRWAIGWSLRDGGPLRRGASVLFSAGNQGAEVPPQSMDQDGYASCPGVIAVGACNVAGTRTSFSCEGSALACTFPSGERTDTDLPALDLTGMAGQRAAASPDGDYFSVSGQTSSAAACTAGVIALLLARRPDLAPAQVRRLLIACCDRIDPRGGGWVNGHSRGLGHGRVNAASLLARVP